MTKAFLRVLILSAAAVGFASAADIDFSGGTCGQAPITSTVLTIGSNSSSIMGGLNDVLTCALFDTNADFPGVMSVVAHSELKGLAPNLSFTPAIATMAPEPGSLLLVAGGLIGLSLALKAAAKRKLVPAKVKTQPEQSR